MINRYFVVDDFYNDPDRLVEAALMSQRDAASRGNYAGVMTKEPFCRIPSVIFSSNCFSKSLLTHRPS
jgi:hypothetical protein